MFRIGLVSRNRYSVRCVMCVVSVFSWFGGGMIGGWWLCVMVMMWMISRVSIVSLVR